MSIWYISMTADSCQKGGWNIERGMACGQSIDMPFCGLSSIPPYRNLLFFCFIHQSKVLIGWSDKMRRNMKINFIFCYGLPRARTRSLEILSGWLKTNVEKYQTRSTGPGSRAPVHSYLSLHNCQSASQWINPRRKNIMSNFSSFCHSVSVFLGVRKI